MNDDFIQQNHLHMMTHHFSWFLGVPMSQHPNTVPTFDLFFKGLESIGVAPARIIELGTGSGGLITWLGLYGLFKEIPIITYDVVENREYPPIFDRLSIDFRLRSIMEPEVQEEIVREVQKPGVTVLLCDNGEKVEEVWTFGPKLKLGDFLLAHDYAINPEHEEYMKAEVWPQCEIHETHILELEGFEPFMQPHFIKVAWMCKRKVNEPRED